MPSAWGGAVFERADWIEDARASRPPHARASAAIKRTPPLRPPTQIKRTSGGVSRVWPGRSKSFRLAAPLAPRSSFFTAAAGGAAAAFFLAAAPPPSSDLRLLGSSLGLVSAAFGFGCSGAGFAGLAADGAASCFTLGSAAGDLTAAAAGAFAGSAAAAGGALCCCLAAPPSLDARFSLEADGSESADASESWDRRLWPPCSSPAAPAAGAWPLACGCSCFGAAAGAAAGTATCCCLWGAAAAGWCAAAPPPLSWPCLVPARGEMGRQASVYSFTALIAWVGSPNRASRALLEGEQPTSISTAPRPRSHLAEPALCVACV
jgi:hypothetical protein